jgi:hypothetical protein
MEDGDSDYLNSMSLLCKKLKEMEHIKCLGEAEINEKRSQIKKIKYGYVSNDF